MGVRDLNALCRKKTFISHACGAEIKRQAEHVAQKSSCHGRAVWVASQLEHVSVLAYNLARKP